LNINNKGAKPIFINGVTSSSSNYTLPAGTYFVYYNGTNYYFRTDGKLTADITGDADTVDGKHSSDLLTSAGSSNSAKKLFLIGAESQSTNCKTYSNSKVYIIDGELTSEKISTQKVTIVNSKAEMLQNPYIILSDDGDLSIFTGQKTEKRSNALNISGAISNYSNITLNAIGTIKDTGSNVSTYCNTISFPYAKATFSSLNSTKLVNSNIYSSYGNQLFYYEEDYDEDEDYYTIDIYIGDDLDDTSIYIQGATYIPSTTTYSLKVCNVYKDSLYNSVLLGNTGQAVIGKYNVSKSGYTLTSNSGSALIVGNGTSVSNRSNAFRVDVSGQVYGGTYNSSGADYAKYYEWEDENTNNEDRVGLFVTLHGKKIVVATPNDEVFGVVSAVPGIVDNAASESWSNMYMKDAFGRKITQTVVVEETTDENGTVVPKHEETTYVINPDYDPNQTYIPREERPEWDAVGLLGNVVVIDDGTCVVDKYCKVTDGGIATYSEDRGFRVMARIDDTHIEIFVTTGLLTH
jgi:hypothetical protein